MRIHGIQLAYDDDESLPARRDRVAGLLADQQGADLVVLPELWAHTGFGSRGWADAAESLDGPTLSMVSDAARGLRTTVHAGSIIERDEQGRLFNTAVLFGADGARAAVYRKIHRFGFGTGEPRLLHPGEDLAVAEVPAHTAGGTGGTGSPPGPAVRVGLATCYDLRFPELFRAYGAEGVDMFVVPAAWPAARVGHWTLLGRARAVENQVFVVQVNTAGTHARTEMAGCSQVVGPWGTVQARAGTGQEVMVAEIDPAEVARARDDFPVLADRRL